MRTTSGEAARAALANLVERHRNTPTDDLPDLKATLRKRGTIAACAGALLLGLAILVLASTKDDAVALFGFVLIVLGTGCLTVGILMAIAKGAPTKAELAAAIAEHKAQGGDGAAPQTAAASRRPAPSPGQSLLKMVGGIAIVVLNLAFLGPSAVYVCLWIAGVAFFISGAVDMFSGSAKSASKEEQG